MKTIIAFALAVCSVFAAIGQIQSDSVKVYYSINKGYIDPDIDNNASSMKSFIDEIRVALDSNELDSILVYGFTSPDGPAALNDTLALRRCQSLADYIIEHAGVEASLIKMHPEGIAWHALRDLVNENHDVPAREKILEVLDNSYLQYYNRQGKLVDKRKEELMSIDESEPYLWMIDNLFPKLRYALAVSVFCGDSAARSGRDSEDAGDCETAEIVTVSSAVADYEYPYEDISSPSEFGLETASEGSTPRHILALKTNLLYYAALLPNLELEWLINDDWSVCVEGNVAWWGRYSNLKSYRLAVIDAEARRWIKPRKPWHGMFAGALVGVGKYDFENGGPGYYGEGIMGGLSFGYAWPVSRTLSFEAEIGAGYLYTRYKEYKPYEGHHLYQRTKQLNYWGPLKLKFSIVWHFLDRNKIGRSNRNI